MRTSIFEISILILCLFACFTSQYAYSERAEFVLIDESVLLFDDSEPDELYDENYTSHFEKQYLKDFFLGEISDDLAEQGIEYLHPQARRDITSALNDLLNLFSNLDDDNYIFYNRYRS